MQQSLRLIRNTLLMLMLSACVPFNLDVQPSPVPLHNLLIDQSLYPAGWILVGTSQDEYSIGNDIENMSISFRAVTPDANVSSQLVLRFTSSDAAARGFDASVARDQSNDPELTESGRIAYRSSTAQRILVRCKVTGLCVVLARYGSYISEFSAYIDSRSLSEIEFKRILGAIDTKMAAVAEK